MARCSVCGQIEGHDLSCPMRELEQQKQTKEQAEDRAAQEKLRVEETARKPVVSFAEVERVKAKVAEIEKTIDEEYNECEADVEQMRKDAQEYLEKEIEKREKIINEEFEKLRLEKAKLLETETEKALANIQLSAKMLETAINSGSQELKMLFYACSQTLQTKATTVIYVKPHPNDATSILAFRIREDASHQELVSEIEKIVLAGEKCMSHEQTLRELGKLVGKRE